MKLNCSNSEFDYNLIARKLAINYFNVSIRPDKTEREDEVKIQHILNKVFGEDEYGEPKIEFKDAAYTRNILIIGAGASKGQIDTIHDGNGAIDAIEKILGFNELLEHEKFGDRFINRYRSLASHYNKKVYGEKIQLDKIKKQLGFEGRLSILLNFFDKQDVLNAIKQILEFQNLPVRFYEIIAHLFKHRFIDVIINFNFDELLDNAIDDEIGSGSYHKVVHDSDCKPITEIVEKNMLRTPIYIKPHGTISSKTSLLFTKEHYIDMSEDMKTLLKSIFMGAIGARKKIVENFNIMIAGFAMESIELNDILFTQMKQRAGNAFPRIKSIDYYIFTDKNDEIKKNFKTEFDIWTTRLADDGIEVSMTEIDTRFVCNDQFSLSYHFENIYKCITNLIDKPFKPVDLFLHDALSLLFPSSEIKLIGNEILEGKKEKYKGYIKFRFIFHLLYELVKWKGRIAINVITNERPGKYYREYLKLLEEDEILQQFDLIGYLKDEVLLKDIELVEGSEIVYELTEFSKKLNMDSPEFDPNNVQVFIERIADKMIQYSLISNSEEKKRIADLLHLKNLLLRIYDSGIYEVSPIYNDPKHARFRPFTKTQIMPTSLTLTYKFFQYSTVKEFFEDWDELYFASDSGTPIYNLHRYCSLPISYLEMFAQNNKKLKVLCSDKVRLVDVDINSGRSLLIENKMNVDVSKEILKIVGRDNCEIKILDSILNIHNIALFLKKGNPVFGFYFFKMDAKNRINPVYFESKNVNDTENLKKIKEIFTLQYSKGTNYDLNEYSA